MEKADIICSFTEQIFFEPVSLSCNIKHVFEKEALEDWLDNGNDCCPTCKKPVKSEGEIKTHEALKLTITQTSDEDLPKDSVQYLPRYLLFDLLIRNKECVESLQRIEKQLDKHAQLKKISLTKLSHSMRVKPETLVGYALQIWPNLMAYFLWMSTQTEMKKGIKTVVESLMKQKAFNTTTLNQSISKKIGNNEHHYSVAHLLLSSAEGRDILKQHTELAKLIGEKINTEHLNSLVVKSDIYHSTLYYLCVDKEVGHEILKKHPPLREKIDQSLLLKIIETGPHTGHTLQDLYNKIPNLTMPLDSCRLKP